MSKELAVINESQLALLGVTEEELQRSSVPMGMENIRPENLAMPRLQVSQGMSAQVMRSKPEYIEGLTVGQLFNTVTQEIYGSSMRVIPIKFSISRLRFVNSLLDCQSKNGQDGGIHSPNCSTCEFSKWGSGKDGKGTDCREYFNFLVMNADDMSPMSISFKSASLSIAKNWAAKILARKLKLSNGEVRPAPAFMTVYELGVSEKTTGGGTFYVPVVRTVGPATNEQISECARFFKSFVGDYHDVDAQDY